MNSYEEQCRADARLAILAELAQQTDATLNSRNLARMIEAIVPRRPVEWVESQIAWLAEMGAVTMKRSELPGIGPVSIATITRFGRDHVELRNLISGVSRPADVV